MDYNANTGMVTLPEEEEEEEEEEKGTTVSGDK
jgi:hypothetical protein